MASRFSLGVMASDFWATLTVRSTGRPDRAGRLILILTPLTVAVVSCAMTFVLTAPTALLPAVALLAGVLLAASGQLISLRARVADSVVMSANSTLRLHFRGSISAVLLTAVVSLIDALLLGTLAVAVTSASGATALTVLQVALTGLALAATTFVALMFVYTARRLYTSYLETFEDGLSIAESTLGRASEVTAAPDPIDDPEVTVVQGPRRT